MDKRYGEKGRHDTGLPAASDAFADAMLLGGERIRGYEMRRRRIQALSIAVALCAALTLGIGGVFGLLRNPRPDSVATAVKSDAAAGAAPDAASFYPGEWVSVVDDNGAREFGGWIGFYAEPRADARRVDVAVGTLVQYGADAGDGFARVCFAGKDGYIRAPNLRRGGAVPMVARFDAVPVFASPGAETEQIGMLSQGQRLFCAGSVDTDGVCWAKITGTGAEGFTDAGCLSFFWGEGCRLDYATLYITDPSGRAFYQHETDAVSLLALQRLLEDLRPIDAVEIREEPHGAMLRLSLSDADDAAAEQPGIGLYFTLPVRGGITLIAENGAAYALPERDWEPFWAIFDAAAERRW